MNKALVIILMYLTANLVFGQNILTVSNNPRIPAQYSDLQKAIDAAKDGDKIYIHPSPKQYAEGGATLSKDVSLIGGGYYNDATKRFLGDETYIGRLTITASSDNILIADCIINRLFLEPKDANDVTFENVTLEHNSISRIDFKPLNENIGSVNMSFRNNLIGIINFDEWKNYGESFKLRIENNTVGLISNGAGSIVVNNNFFNPDFASARTALENLTDFTFFNNIFYGNKSKNRIGVSTLSACIFDYNLSFETVDNFSGGTQNTFGQNNIENKDPQFTTFSNTSIIETNFTLKSGSPAKGKGSNGTDIGILGGQYPFEHTKPYNYPAVTNIIIANPIVDQNGTIKFTIKAENQ
ncbi:MAG: hypothetical protein OHK0038_04930 [Flammeovirgaceae bacterium]